MTLPICRHLDEIPDALRITLPGGIEIERINLLEMIDPLLAPLMPVFNIIDTIVAIMNCIKAIPDVITDPTAIGACLKELGEKIAQLLKLLPQLSLPLLLLQLIDLLIGTLNQAKNEIEYLQNQVVRITQAIDRAKELDDPNLMSLAQCAQQNIAQEAANVGKSLTSLGKLIGLINLFMSMVGGPEIPDMSDLSGKPLDKMIEPLDALLTTLQAARRAVPIP
ncbi:MAG: hypothetical protein QNJ97_27815 [Myxococcota bacterium]|nr:hypothetical protein [Myxococcota bacterium]